MKFNTGVQITGQIYWQMKTGDGYLELPQDKNSIQQVLSYRDQAGILKYITGEYPFGIQRVLDSAGDGLGDITFTTSMTFSTRAYPWEPAPTDPIPSALSGTFRRLTPSTNLFTGAGPGTGYIISYHPNTGYYIYDKNLGLVLYNNPYEDPNTESVLNNPYDWNYNNVGPLEIEIRDYEDYWEDNYYDPVNTPKINSQVTGKYRRPNFSTQIFTGKNGNYINYNNDFGLWQLFNATNQRVEYYTWYSDFGYWYPNWTIPDPLWAIRGVGFGEAGSARLNVTYTDSIFKEQDYRTTGILSLGSDAFIIKKGGKGFDANGNLINKISENVLDKDNNLLLDVLNFNVNKTNIATGIHNSILGGENHVLLADTRNSMIGAGFANRMNNGNSSSILGGTENSIINSNNSSIHGGTFIRIESSTRSTIAGGYNNTISQSNSSFIGGGDNNSVVSNYSFLGAGGSNTIRALGGHPYNVLVGGAVNSLYGGNNFLGGGLGNSIGSYAAIGLSERYLSYSFLGGGRDNFLLGQASVIAGGYQNRNVANRGFVGGGYKNHIDINLSEGDLYNNLQNYTNLLFSGLMPIDGAIVGGAFNRLEGSSKYSFIGGGYSNRIKDSLGSFIPGGSGNYIFNSDKSFILGSRGFIINTKDLGDTIQAYNNYFNTYATYTPRWNNKGVGMINDGYIPTYNAGWAKTLNLGFTHGIRIDPYINIRASTDTTPYSNEDYIESIQEINSGLNQCHIGEYGEYINDIWDGYTGWTEVDFYNYFGRSKFINIGTENVLKNSFTDISGFYAGEEGKEKTLLRVQNPSVVIGSFNSGGHQNVILGLNNLHYFEAPQDIQTGLYPLTFSDEDSTWGRWTGIKCLNGSPWPFSSTAWPIYQGQNQLIGCFNHATGRHVSILGASNLILENRGPSLVLGSANIVLPRKTKVFFDTGAGINNFTLPTGNLSPGETINYKSFTAVYGFSNQEHFGTKTNIVGSENTSASEQTNIFGSQNMVSGYHLTIVGGGNLNNGSHNLIYGTDNIIPGGAKNIAIGQENYIVPQSTGVAQFNSNILIGEANSLAGSDGILIGTTNRFGSTSGLNYTDTTLIGRNNISELGGNVLLGNYNYSSGTASFTLGFNNQISKYNANGILGSSNILEGRDSYILGSENRVRAHGAMALGRKAYAYNKNQISIAGGALGTSWPGSSQKTTLFWKGVTSGAQIMDLTLDAVNHSNNYVEGKAFVPSGAFWHGTLNIVAVETGLNSYRTELKSVIVVNKGSVVATPEQKTISSKFIGAGASNWQVTAAGNSTYKSLDVIASGEANKIIFWNVIGEFNEVFVPTKETVSINKFINNEIVETIIANGVNWYESNPEAITPDTENAAPINQRAPESNDYY